jgi:hypothetical protein
MDDVDYNISSHLSKYENSGPSHGGRGGCGDKHVFFYTVVGRVEALLGIGPGRAKPNMKASCSIRLLTLQWHGILQAFS